MRGSRPQTLGISQPVLAHRLQTPGCDDVPLPITGIRGMPLHALRGPGVLAATQIKRMQDRTDCIQLRLH